MCTKDQKEWDTLWRRLHAAKPTLAELVQLSRHLQWLRLPAHEKVVTEYLPGMGRRRGDL